MHCGCVSLLYGNQRLKFFLFFFFHFDKTASVNRIVKMMILFGGVSQMELPEDVDDHDL